MSTAIQQAYALLQQGKNRRAIKLFRQILKSEPNNFLALDGLGVIYGQEGRYDEALRCFNKAVKIQPDDFAVHANCGIALRKLNKNATALISFDNAIRLNPGHIDSHNNRGVTLMALGHHSEAIASFDEVISLNPGHINGHMNRGLAQLAIKSGLEKARASFQRVVELNPNVAEAYFNLGLVGYELHQFDEALTRYNQAIALRPDYADAYFNRGCVHRDSLRYQHGYDDFNKCIALNARHPYAYGERLLAQLHVCDWNKFDQRNEELIRKFKQGQIQLAPFMMTVLTTSPVIQQRVAETYTAARFPTNQLLGPISARKKSDRIRIGYFSSDFRPHPVMSLMAEMYQRHDRTHFEIHAFSFGPACKDDTRECFSKSVDTFHDISHMSDDEAATLSRSLGIDIAVDLNGATANARTGIFARQAAPVQVHYLGFPGTMGADYFEYIIADPIMIPTTHQQYYSEKVAYLPNSYQANISDQEISDKPMTRSGFGLPDDAFIFCCFNNNYKITPNVFDVWMRLLHQIDGSVLWLFKASQSTEDNLRKEANQRGVDPDRLVFAERVSLPEHLARHRLADLFVDTFVYNAHATASAALWAGLPLLTKIDDSFPSRTGTSLLNAVGLPELMTSSEQEYEAMAIQLATHPEELQAIKRKLQRNLKTAPLFDAALFTRHIEAAYVEMLRCYEQGCVPEHIYVRP